MATPPADRPLRERLPPGADPADHGGVSAPVLRAAGADDQGRIRALVRGARLNPADLDWRRFTVVEDGGVVVGVGQVRVHGDGSREIASLVVAPEHRGRGVAVELVDALVASSPGPLYVLLDRAALPSWARRWGFRPVRPAALPRPVRRELRVGRVVAGVLGLRHGRRIRIVAARRDPA